MEMDILTADESTKSNDTMREDKPVKVNGDMNGSIEGMEVDDDSIDGADVATDESIYGSSRAHDGDGDPEDHSDIEKSEGDSESKTHEDSEPDKVGSQFGSEYGAKSESQPDAIEEDGIDDATSVNSEEEDQLLNSDNEKAEKGGEEMEDVEEDLAESVGEEPGAEGEDSEEEGDINGPDAEEDPLPTETDDKNNDEEKIKEENPEKEGEISPQERNGDVTPKKKKSKEAQALSLTPRRSSRAVQKPQRFGQGSDDGEEDEEDDIEDVEEVSHDPLGDTIDKENHRFPRMIGNTTIVVSDGKKLADIAAQRAQAAQPKKEPTLVIIDTNSILSGKSGVPMQTAGGVTITQTSPAARAQNAQMHKPKPPAILPTLTDDMYVVEAPSFIVPYVYEKPPVKKFKKYLRRMLKEVRRQQEEEDRREEEEEAREAEAEAKKKAGGDVDVKKEPEDTKEKDAEKSDKVEDMETDEKDGEKNGPKPNAEVEKEKLDTEVKTEELDIEVKKEETGDSVEVKKEVEESKKPEKEVESSDEEESEEEEKKKPTSGSGSYFDNPLGKFFMSIGMNQVQEFVQTDLLKQQKKKQKAGKGTEETQQAIISLKKNLILSKESNEPYAMEQTKCEFCSFKTESKLIMAHHLETPHMRNYVYRCNFCPLEVRGPHDILYHMEAEHCVRGRLERAPAFHQCPQCPFEDNQKGKLTRHLMTCGKKFRADKNLEPPPDWEPPAKIPRLPRKPNAMPHVNPMYSQMAKNMSPHLLPKVGTPLAGAGASPMMRAGRGRPVFPQMTPQQQKLLGQRAMPPQLQRGFYRNPAAASPVMMPTYPQNNNPLYQAYGRQAQALNAAMPALQRLGITPHPTQQKNPATVKLLNQPSISITPLPRQAGGQQQAGVQPIRPGSAAAANARTTFVICEICDGYIKDLEQLRNHMQWIHKVKIHPKMIYNRPPLNCQKCQFRFFTDQGLERHLLGSHGLVTSSMQDQANRGKDGGRCPVCGKVYQWKLLNHVARDHNMTLKPAHLSYKCTVCTATFGMYKQFESHVYSAHSVVAKRVMEKKNGQAPSTSRTDTASLLKPLKINDEITIIPQPSKKAAQQRPVPGNYRVGTTSKSRGPDSVQVIDLEDSPNKGENGATESLTAVKERLKRRHSLEIRQLESDGEESGSDGEPEGEGEGEPPKPAEEPMEEDDDDQPTDNDDSDE